MRNMSFSLTTRQVLNRSKTVTRRMGWKFLKPGDRIRAVKKAMGLKKGEKVEQLAVIEVVRVSFERLDHMRYAEPEQARAELQAEGVADRCESWNEFLIRYFWPQGAKPDDVATRIEFKYVDEVDRA